MVSTGNMVEILLKIISSLGIGSLKILLPSVFLIFLYLIFFFSSLEVMGTRLILSFIN